MKNTNELMSEKQLVRAVEVCRRTVSCGRRLTTLAVLVLASAAMAFGQSDPWSTTANRIGIAFTGPIAKGFSLVAIVVGGLQMAFSEGAGRREIGGLVFGLGLALGATSFMTWLFF